MLNIQGLSDTISPKALNLSALSNSNRREKRQARTLTVQEVKSLESFMADEKNVMIDRFACGCFLFALFSRSRWSDLRCAYGFASDIIEIDGKIAGYLVYKTRSHKTASTIFSWPTLGHPFHSSQTQSLALTSNASPLSKRCMFLMAASI